MKCDENNNSKGLTLVMLLTLVTNRTAHEQLNNLSVQSINIDMASNNKSLSRDKERCVTSQVSSLTKENAVQEAKKLLQ